VKYYSKAGTAYNIQSPYFHHFIQHVFDTSKLYYFFKEIEQERKRLLSDEKQIDETDFGAGRTFRKPNKQIQIKQIAQKSLSSRYQCRILSNLVLHTKPGYILELGTSLGISTLYLAKSSPSSSVITLEGNPQIAKQAQKMFHTAKASNIKLITGSFDESLSGAVENIACLDLVYLDGNHKKDATVRYFQSLKNKFQEQTIVVVDDIRWSPEMNEAWEILKADEKVTSSLELWKTGFLFFNSKLSREHHVYIPYPFKPWNTGLFGK